MSNFWQMSDGKTPEKAAEYESSGGFELIPDNTTVLAVIDEAGWKAGWEGEPDYINIRWTILAPAEYKNRKVFQKVKVLDEKATTADNAKRMLMAIDTNAGGKLATLDHEPEDEELIAALVNKQMVLKLRVWKMEGRDGEPRTGNWVAAVSAKQGGGAGAAKARAAVKTAKPAQTATVAAENPDTEELGDDDIPF